MRQAAVTGADRADSRQERLIHSRGRSKLTLRLSQPKVDIHPNVHHTSGVCAVGGFVGSDAWQFMIKTG